MGEGVRRHGVKAYVERIRARMHPMHPMLEVAMGKAPGFPTAPDFAEAQGLVGCDHGAGSGCPVCLAVAQRLVAVRDEEREACAALCEAAYDEHCAALRGMLAGGVTFTDGEDPPAFKRYRTMAQEAERLAAAIRERGA